MSSRMRLAVLGSTGSIGCNTLDVAARHPERIEVCALSAHSRVDELIAQCLHWKPRWAVVTNPAKADGVAQRGKTRGMEIKMAAGGLAAGHKQADGIAKKGKTRGMQVKMAMGGKC